MKKNKLFLIIGIAVVLVIGIVVAVLLLTSNKEPEPVVVEYFEYNLDENYSNLLAADNAKQRIVKYRVCIQYTGEKTSEILEKNKTKLMNNVDEILRGTKAEDLDKPNGKEKLRGRIKNMVIDSLELDDTVITDIFLQPFVIQ